VYDPFHSQNTLAIPNKARASWGALTPLPLDPLSGLCTEPAGDLDGPKTIASLERRP